jgi:hypothetical protein
MIKNTDWFSPYDNARRIGSIIQIGATEVLANLTLAGTGDSSWLLGQRVPGGEVNEFVFIDVGETAILGKIVKVWLDGGERLSVDSLSQVSYENHPVGVIQVLVSIDSSTGKSYQGITRYPKLGAQVFSAHPLLSKKMIEGDINAEDINLTIAELPNDNTIAINVTPEKLFSRHCAILGATGGGKSWSVANILERVRESKGKAILIDATGEFSSMEAYSFYVGDHPAANKNNSLTFPHWQFTDSDLRAFLRPSSQSQTPKLVEAIKSLKFINMQRRGVFFNQLAISERGTLMKAGQAKKNFEFVTSNYSNLLSYEGWSFSALHEQIIEECVWPSGGNYNKPDLSIWGGKADNDVGHCLNLISRVKSYSDSPYLKWMIDTNPELKTIPNLLNEFISDRTASGIVRLDLSMVPFESNAREILVNAIGRYLLQLARSRIISHESPMLVFIDEAHQFLNKKIGDEFNRFELDSFGNIAKEGRKYGLNVVISTQRPRDIPEDVLSQIGSLIVHRLTNQHDQDIVKKSVGEIDLRTASFLPTLGQGEALLLGVDFSFPVIIKMKAPEVKPLSRSAEFSKAWLK